MLAYVACLADQCLQLMESRMEVRALQQKLRLAHQKLAERAVCPERGLERENNALREELETADAQRERQATRIVDLENEIKELRQRVRRITSERDQAEKDRDAAERRLRKV